MNNLSKRLEIIAIGMIKDAKEPVTRKNVNRMLKFVKGLYYNSEPDGKLQMKREWDHQGL